MSDALVALLTYRSELDTATAKALVARLGGTVVTVTGTTHTAADGEVVLAGNAAGVDVTLPAPTADAKVTVVNTGAAGTVTVDTPGAETINGAATASLTAQYSVVRLVSDGTNWFEI